MRTVCQQCGQKEYAKGLCQPCYDRTRTRASSPEHRAAYRTANLDRLRKEARDWNARHAERCSVKAHHQSIFRSNDASYQNMPFFDGWNPDKGGSFKKAEGWIIRRLGRRPDKTYHLHIVDRSIGFMPGNLAWVPRSKHQQEELVNRLLLENQRLKKIIRGMLHEI